MEELAGEADGARGPSLGSLDLRIRHVGGCFQRLESCQENHFKTKVDAAAAQQSSEMEGSVCLAALQELSLVPLALGPLSCLEDNHSHFIICDNGQV